MPPATTFTSTSTTAAHSPSFLAHASSSSASQPAGPSSPATTSVPSFNVQLGYRLLRFVAAFVAVSFAVSFGAVYAFARLSEATLSLPLSLLRATILFSGIFAVTAAHASCYAEKQPLPPPRLSWVFVASPGQRTFATCVAFSWCAVAIPFGLLGLNLVAQSSVVLIIRISLAAATFQYFSTVLRPFATVPPFNDFAQWRVALFLHDPYWIQALVSIVSSTAVLSAFSTGLTHVIVWAVFRIFWLPWAPVTQLLVVFSTVFGAGNIVALTSQFADYAIVWTKPVSHSNLELIQAADPDKGAITRHHALWELAASATANPIRREQVYNDQPNTKSWTTIQAPLVSCLTGFAEQVAMFDLPIRKQPEPATANQPSSTTRPTLQRDAPISTSTSSAGSVSGLFYRGTANAQRSTSQPIPTPTTPATFAWPTNQPSTTSASAAVTGTVPPTSAASKPAVPPTLFQRYWTKGSDQVWQRLRQTQAATKLEQVHVSLRSILNDVLLAFRLAALTVHFQLVAWCAVAISRLVVHSYVQDPYGLVFPDLAKIVPALLRVLRAIQGVQRATPQWNWKRFDQDFVVRGRVKDWRAISANSLPGTAGWNMDDVDATFPFSLNQIEARRVMLRVNEWANPEMVAAVRLVFVYEVCAASLAAMYVRYERYIRESVAPKLSEEDRVLLHRVMAD